MLKPWLVASPEYSSVIPVLDDGSGPLEWGADVVFIEAETRHDALLLGVALMKRQGAKYLDDCENPYTGVLVEPQTCPVHGEWTWKGDHYECPRCPAIVGSFDEA